MISCTEFIPLYSEFFKYLAKRGGGDEAVHEYWNYLADYSLGDLTNPDSLASKCELLGGFDGARAYWGKSIPEEACDVYSIYNPKLRYSYSIMRRCPSKQILLALEHVEPYHDYCEHCRVIYDRVISRYGARYERDHTNIDRASCSSILYEEGHKPDFDFTVPTPDCKVADVCREGQKYLHRDFHISGDFLLKYCGDKFGAEAVVGFMRDYAKYYYAPVISDFKNGGLAAIEAWLKNLYEVEEAPQVLHTELSDTELKVRIDKSPVIEYMATLNQKPSVYYIEQTRTLYAAMADEAGFGFSLDKYDEETGEAEYRFFVK